MDRFTRTADIIKAYYSYKQTADSATFVKKVCSFFDFIKDESLSDADLNLLLFLANEAGIPQYYDLLKSKFTNAEIGDESINSLTMSALFHDASLIRGDSKLHRYLYELRHQEFQPMFLTALELLGPRTNCCFMNE